MFRSTLQQLARRTVPQVLASRQPSAPRSLSTDGAQPLINLDVDDKSGVAILTLNKPPVNSLNLELLTEISGALDQLNANKARGLILTSSAKSVFSAGLDIMEMYKPDLERAGQFWTTLQDVWIKLYGSSYPTAAAINGHSPAGGCLLAISCEYRVMCPKFTIGLNETLLGIVAPQFFVDSYLNVMSRRDVERALTLGQLFTTDEALRVGLIDEVATDREDAVAKCSAFLGRFRKVVPQARAVTKLEFRGRALAALCDDRKADLDGFFAFIQDPLVQHSLEVYLQSLKKK